jgi:hypothetical protein
VLPHCEGVDSTPATTGHDGILGFVVGFVPKFCAADHGPMVAIDATRSEFTA